MEERLERAYASKTYAKWEALVADLPAVRGPGADTLVLKTHMSAIKQAGPWVVPPRIVAESKMLNILIDFTKATCLHREVTLEASCGMGTVQVVVPAGWAVRIDPASTNTAHIANEANGPVDPSDPVLTVVGHPRSGHIKIKQARRQAKGRLTSPRPTREGKQRVGLKAAGEWREPFGQALARNEPSSQIYRRGMARGTGRPFTGRPALL